MIYFLISIIIILLGVLFFIKSGYSDGIEALGWFFVIIGGLWLFIATVALPVDRTANYAFIEQFEATRLTLEDIRSVPDLSGLERFALQKEIIERNEKLAGKQYYSRNVWFKWHFPKELQEVKFIRNIDMSEKKEVKK